jgi:PAS domain S-box-containing protein
MFLIAFPPEGGCQEPPLPPATVLFSRSIEMSTVNAFASKSLHPVPGAHSHDQESCGHTVQFYAEDQSLVAALTRFVSTSLSTGGSAIVIATKPHREALTLELQASGLDTMAAIWQGRFVLLDAAETLAKFTVDGWPDAALFTELIGGCVATANAASHGENSRVVAFGEMVSLLWAQGKPDAALRLEQLWNDLATTQSFSLRCAYPIGGFARAEDSEPFQRICAEHSAVIPSESYMELSSEAERLRNISQLQQKAGALETEKAQRKSIQRTLQLRESELADILENAVEGVQQVGPDQTIMWTNKALLNLLGYAAEEYIGHPLGAFHVQQHIFEEFWAKLMRREDIYDFPAELRCKDGSVKQVVIHSNGLWENGKFVHTRCFVRDVTEQKRLEQVLRTAEKQAAMGRVAAGIAHEINNPLETVTNVFYLLRDHPSLDADARELARIANEEMERVRHIARQTLAFCRDTESPVSVSLRLILDDVLEAFRRQIQTNHITVERNIDTDGLVVAFPVELRQIFINLIANALQAMPEGGALRVSLRHSSERSASGARPGLRVSITDTGTGIPVKHRHKIFEPFFTTKAEKGTGLGLWVSRGIVQKLDGTIRFRCTKWRGRTLTSFAVFIPTDGLGFSVS